MIAASVQRWCFVVAFAVMLAVLPAAAQTQEIKKFGQVTGKTEPSKSTAVNIVRQGFPARGADANDLTKSDTAWEIEWTITNPDNGAGKNSSPSSVLAIRSAKFMFKDSAGKVRWFTVLKNLEVGEIMVPYDRMEPVFLDVTEHAFRLIPAKPEYLGPACVLPGEILDSTDARLKNKVMKEVHDDGLRWLNGSNKGRRGEKMLIWSIFDGGNYRYILEYGFLDDGVITCRIGATAHNFFSKQKDGRDVHLHVGCWRWDPELSEAAPVSLGNGAAGGGPADGGTAPGNPAIGAAPAGGGGNVGAAIGGAAKNQVLVVRRLQRTPVANGMFKVDIAPFNPNEDGKASEGFVDWKPNEFTILRVQSTVRKNSSKDPQFTAYDVIPQRMGAVRSYPWKYAFANHDYWVTQRRSGQDKYRDVPQYAGRSKPLDNSAVTLWHNAPALHVPRGEDYGADGQSAGQGSAITTWTGFMLRPVNLFDSTPLYTQPKAGGK